MGSDRSSKRDRDHESSRSSRRRDEGDGGRSRHVDDDDGKTREDYDRERERKKSRRSKDDDDFDRRDRDRERERRDFDRSDPYARRRDDDEYSRPSRRDRDRDRGYDRHDDRDRGYSSRYDDGRGGRGGGGGGQGGAWDWRGMASRGDDDRRSPTPEGTRPISQRIRRHTKWDIHAEGFENVGANEAKMSGVFGLSGQSRGFGMPAPALMMGHDGKPSVVVPQALPPIRLGQGGEPPAGLAGIQLPPRPGTTTTAAAPSTSATPQADRQSRRLYVGNIGHEATEDSMVGFFNVKLRELDLVDKSLEGEPCVAAQIARDKGYAFVEFRSIEETTNAMGFDGIIYQGNGIKIRRPKDYSGPDVLPPKRIHVPGVVSTNVPDGPNKIYIGSIPTYLNEDQVMELLKAFGELRAFNLVKEAGNGASKGFGFCEYVDPSLTDIACQGLNDMELGDRKLIVQRASTGLDKRANNASATGANSGPLGIPLPSAIQNVANGFAGAGGDAGSPTKAMVLLNMVTPEELSDDTEYSEIVEDIRDECARYGTVVDVRIPRPLALSKGSAAQTWKRTVDGEVQQEGAEDQKPKEREGVGRVYVRFDQVDQCENALKAIAGRQFGGRLVIAAYLNEEDWPGDEDGGTNAEQTSAQATGPAPATAADSFTSNENGKGNGNQEAQSGEAQQQEQDDDGGEADMVDSD